MKKLILLFVLLGSFSFSQARTFDVEAAYTGSSHFDRAHIGATAALNLNTQAGLEATYTNEHHFFKHPAYSVAAPVSFNFNLMQFELRPFYYFKNKSGLADIQDSSAFGLQTRLVLSINEDTVEDLYTRAFIGASFARQKGTVFYEDDTASNRYYSQFAYTLGLQQDLYRAFSFCLAGTVFQYPDGISRVAGLYSVMDQQELADTQTLDIVHELTKYTVAARLTRLWAENGSSLYLGYRFGEYHTTDSEHSIIVGNSFPVTQQVKFALAYNHVRTVHNDNKRDIWQARLSVAF